MPDCVAFSRCAARVNEPSSHTAMTARICRSGTFAMRPSKNRALEKLMTEARIYYLALRSSRHRISAIQQCGAETGRVGANVMGTANFAIAVLERQQRGNG